MQKEIIKQLSLSWFRAAAAATVALYLAGETDPKKLSAAFAAGFLGPALKWIDPNSKEFGVTKK